MQETPKFIRDFSKEHSQNKRDRIAHDIKTQRKSFFEKQEEQKTHLKDTEVGIANLEKERQEQETRREQLEQNLEYYSGSFLKKTLSYFKIKALREEALAISEEGDKIASNLLTLKEKKQKIKQEIKTLGKDFENLQKIIPEFLEKEKEKWAETDYHKEDIEKYFKEDFLEKLSLEDYTLLLKRFPSEMLTHVTRQGVRDHVGMFYHQAGEGDYSNGFIEIVKDGRLKSPLGVHISEDGKDKSIAEFLELQKCESREEGYTKLKEAVLTDEFDIGYSGSYADRKAIHFAVEEVANAYYGAERGNEIFFSYPSNYIASSYFFDHQLHRAGGGIHNDRWIYEKEKTGIPLDAGLVFIPKETLVNPETGSRYELDEDNTPLKNEEYIKIFKDFFEWSEFDAIKKELAKQYPSSRKEYIVDLEKEENEDVQYFLEKTRGIRKKIQEKFGPLDRKILSSMLSHENMKKLSKYKNPETRTDRELMGMTVHRAIESCLKESGILYKEAKNPISSQEFWENYFKEYPEQKPSKIVYYEGVDPTQALRNWREENGLEKKSDDPYMGFAENKIDPREMKFDMSQERFLSLARKAIDTFFDNKKTS